MTGSQRIPSTWVGAAIAGVMLVFVAAAGAEQHELPPIEMISAKVGGKNVFVPGTIVTVAGRSRTVTVFNTTEMPHGFTIRAAGIQTVLPPQEEHQVEIPALEPGVYAIDCHLHPPHRSAQLLVMGNP